MEESLVNPTKATEHPSTQSLRLHTSIAHRSVERALNLPQSIGDFQDYRRWLTRFFGIYFPLETRLGTFSEWDEWDIPFDRCRHTASLSKDLATLNVSTEYVEFASCREIPALSNFGEALGSLYVIEGSKLGGRFILNDLSARLGPRIEGATSFFEGHGAQMGRVWNSFIGSLDKFFYREPNQFSTVCSGALATFTALEAWMSPLAGRSGF